MSRQDEPDKLNSPDQNRADSGKADGPPDGAMQRFEAELAALSPRAMHLDRDRLMFLAGQSSASQLAKGHGGWAWPAAFSAMSALAVGLLLTVVLRQPREVVRLVQVPRQDHQTAPEAHEARHNDRGSPPIERIPTQQRSFAADTIAPAAAEGHPYVELRDRVLAMDLSAPRLDSWSAEAPRGEASSHASPAPYHDFLDSLLHGG